MGDMRIMLVDDNGDLRRGMRDYLARQEGMKVVAECPSGAEALEALGKVRVDVMVLDLIMPQMDGFALMEEVRRQQLANPPQIIVVSALGRDDFIMRAVQLGARFYMVKPFDMASFQEKYSAFLRLIDRLPVIPFQEIDEVLSPCQQNRIFCVGQASEKFCAAAYPFQIQKQFLHLFRMSSVKRKRENRVHSP